MANITFGNIPVDMRNTSSFGILELQSAYNLLETYNPIGVNPLVDNTNYMVLQAYDSNDNYVNIYYWITSQTSDSASLSKMAVEIESSGVYVQYAGHINISSSGNFSGTINSIVQKNNDTGQSYVTASGFNFFIDNNTVNSDLATLLASSLSGNDAITGGGYADYLKGFKGNDRLTGNGGNDTLDGGAGNDTMIGNAGNDTYIVDSISDIVTELSGKGIDLIKSSITYSLADTDGTGSNGGNVEKLTLIGTSSINGTGNNLANMITGNAAANILNGGSAADTMIGGNGSDIYYIDDAGDIVNETNTVTSTGGTDLVCSSLSTYTLEANVENGRVMATGTADLIGNGLNNIFYAGAGNNVLDGSTGTDTVTYSYAAIAVTVSLAVSTAQGTGGSGTDTLASIENLTGSNYNDTLAGNADANVIKGLAGNDTLNGGIGADGMIGGDGNDTYYVDNALDVATETNATASTGGKDTVCSTIDYTLAANIENIRILGADALNATGNTLNNIIYGGAGDNTINGMTGTDMAAYNYATEGVNVSLARSTVQATGGSGSDTLLSIEDLTGSNFNDTLIGNTLANSLNGRSGDDVLVGGKGKDSLTGGLGADLFDFNAISETGLTNATWDVINDFSHAQGDKIDLSTIDAKMSVTGDQAFSFIGGKVFSSTNAAGQLRFDSATHILYGSTDADSVAEFAIQLTGVVTMVTSDFVA